MLVERSGMSVKGIAAKAQEKKDLWGLLDKDAKSFLDNYAAWRELGFNPAVHLKNFDSFESLPGWAKKNLIRRQKDEREHLYTLEAFDNGQTHDHLWNAIQMQLVREGWLHHQFRRLWGKKIYEWTPSAHVAIKVMLHINNKYALDGRDPNSIAGIFWILGRYDKPCKPEHPVFGEVRYLGSKSMARKINVSQYIAEYSP